MSHNIHTGFWVDHSFSPIYGATVTLPLQWANLLVSTLTIAVTISASAFWIIVAFFLHQGIVSDDKVDPVGLQHQVLLRNSESPLTTLWELWLIRTAWWKNKVSGLSRRTFYLAVPSFIVWISFTIASIFVSAVASKSYADIRVLQNPENCGLFKYHTSDAAGSIADGAWEGQKNNIAQAYVDAWYSNSTGFTFPSLYPVNTLSYNTTINSSCPFDTKYCLLGPNSGFSMTTDLLDSHTMFGFNAAKNDRVQLQKNVTCALVYAPSSNIWEVNNTIYYNLGYTYSGNSTSVTTFNFTYSYNRTLYNSGIAYLLRYLFYVPDVSNPPWVPLSGLKPTNSNIAIFFLAQNTVLYAQPVLDPWFYANGTVNTTTGFFRENSFVKAMGCVDQYRICNSKSGICTPFSSIGQVMDNLFSIGLSNTQLATAKVLRYSAESSYSGRILSGLGDGALLANQNISGGVYSPGLPPNQWQIEVTRWFQTSLAKMQEVSLQYSSNAYNFDTYSYLLPPNMIVDPGDPTNLGRSYSALCSKQLIQSSGQVQSFSFLGLMIVIVVTIILSAIALSLESCAYWVRRKRGKSPTSRRAIARQTDEKFQLLRMAIGDSGRSGIHWTEGKYEIPITKAGVDLSRPRKADNCFAWYDHEFEGKENISPQTGHDSRDDVTVVSDDGVANDEDQPMIQSPYFQQIHTGTWMPQNQMALYLNQPAEFHQPIHTWNLNQMQYHQPIQSRPHLAMLQPVTSNNQTIQHFYQPMSPPMSPPENSQMYQPVQESPRRIKRRPVGSSFPITRQNENT